MTAPNEKRLCKDCVHCAPYEPETWVLRLHLWLLGKLERSRWELSECVHPGTCRQSEYPPYAEVEREYDFLPCGPSGRLFSPKEGK